MSPPSQVIAMSFAVATGTSQEIGVEPHGCCGAAIALRPGMARLRADRRKGVLRVTVSGRLTRTDMRRLEHACGPALVSDPPNLELDLHAVTYLDATAHAIVKSIASRGVRVLP
jgi:hypothetical protein